MQEAYLRHSWPLYEITNKADETPADLGTNIDILSEKEKREEASLIAKPVVQLNEVPLMMDLTSGPNAPLCKAFALCG